MKLTATSKQFLKLSQHFFTVKYPYFALQCLPLNIWYPTQVVWCWKDLYKRLYCIYCKSYPLVSDQPVSLAKIAPEPIRYFTKWFVLQTFNQTINNPINTQSNLYWWEVISAQKHTQTNILLFCTLYILYYPRVYYKMHAKSSCQQSIESLCKKPQFYTWSFNRNMVLV